MSLLSNLQSYITRVGTEFKSVKTMISGSATGDVTALNTTAANLVSAVNEVKVTADSAAGGGVAINDGVTNITDAWSSNKIALEITTGVTNALEGEDLSDLAAAITALGVTDAGLVSTASAQSFNTAQKLQACTNIGIGDPETDLVALFNAAII